MAVYLNRDEILKWKETITTDDYSGNETMDVVAVEEILDVEPADVIEREKIDKAIKEMEREQNSDFWNSVFQKGIGYTLEILKKNLGE